MLKVVPGMKVQARRDFCECPKGTIYTIKEVTKDWKCCNFVTVVDIRTKEGKYGIWSASLSNEVDDDGWPFWEILPTLRKRRRDVET